MKGYLDEETPLQDGLSKPIRRLPLVLGVASLVELAIIAAALCFRPSFLNPCSAVPMGTWALALLCFCVVHLAYSYIIEWIERTCPWTEFTHLILKVLQIASLLLAGVWVGFGHVWAYRQSQCGHYPEGGFALQLIAMGLSDALIVFSTAVLFLSFTNCQNDLKEKERQLLFH